MVWALLKFQRAFMWLVWPGLSRVFLTKNYRMKKHLFSKTKKGNTPKLSSKRKMEEDETHNTGSRTMPQNIKRQKKVIAPSNEEMKENDQEGMEICCGEVWWTRGRDILPAAMQQLDETNRRPVHDFENWFEMGPSWSILHYQHPSGGPISDKIAAFDMDGTLIETKSGKSFAQNAKDWKFWRPCVPEKLRELVAEGFKVVIISNQLGLEKGKTTVKELATKVTAILEQVDAPIDAFFAGASDIFRKPSPGMWDLLLKHFNGGVIPDPHKCVYVGDAAGRPKDKTRKKDFSAGDLKYALNLGIDFKTPEAFFLGSKQSIHNAGSTYIKDMNPASLRELAVSAPMNMEHDGQELVVLCAPPAAGKSTLCKNGFPEYERVNRDTLKTMQKCKKVAEEHLESGRSVIIDNLNRDVKTRKEWLNLAKKYNVPVRCVRVNVPKDICFHLNTFRSVNPYAVDNRKVPSMVIHGFFKNVEEPTTNEGFCAVEKVSFLPGPFSSKNEEDLFYMFSIP
mmetsp:Transcript_8974/g.11896  ORF Transcript_8974/g.11896 Transcript_8974/m.11896 type:complete len:509 (-) Transcript_8974:211-1737(-)